MLPRMLKYSHGPQPVYSTSSFSSAILLATTHARPCPMYRLNACAHAPTHPSTITSSHAVGTSSNRFSFRFSNLLLPQTMSVRASQANRLHQSCHRSLCLGGTVGQLQAFGKCSNAKQVVSHQH